MTSACMIDRSRVTTPSLSLHLYEAHGEHVSITETNSYAKKLVRNHEKAFSKAMPPLSSQTPEFPMAENSFFPVTTIISTFNNDTALYVGFYQRETHTYGQLAAILPMELGFRMGVPVLHAAWSTSDALPKWIACVLKLCTGSLHDAALKEISLATGRLKAKKEFAQLSTDLKRFDLKTLPDVVLVSLLRNTYSIRSQISCWNFLLDQTEEILKKRKREPRFLLRGLKS